ncbi:MAG TPA: hypothetical protein VFZ42_00890 [Chitinophagaceae bacterium]
MDRQTAFIIIIAIAIMIIALLAIKNRRDRKKIFPPGSTDPVEEENMEQHQQRDKL